MKNTISLVLCGVLAVLFLYYPHQAIQHISAVTQYTIHHFGLVFIILSSVLLILSLVLALSPYGRIRLGGESAKPDFSNTSWVCMLIAAGMGSGLIFWGVAEPLHHFSALPSMVSDSNNPKMVALGLTYFHWGAHAWSLYAISGLTLAWFAYNRHRSILISSAFTDHSSKNGFAVFDFIALVAVIFGVAGTLANAIALLQTGVGRVLPHAELGMSFRVILLLGMAIIFIGSAVLGLKRGIRKLSLFNMIFAILLVMIVTVWSGLPTTLLTVVESTIAYVKLLPAASFSIDGGWSEQWTVIYLLWWICWTPFVGPFIARISYGRTIREFLLCVIFAPTIFSISWFSAFTGGLFNEAIYLPATIHAIQQSYTEGLFQFFSYFPFASCLSIAAILLLITFVITSADSALYVASLFMEKSGEEALRVKVLWGVFLVSITLGLIARNDVDLNKQIAIIGAIPFSLILIEQVIMFLMDVQKSQRKDKLLPSYVDAR